MCKGSVPEGYSGWLLLSPDGLKTIECRTKIQEETKKCGARIFLYIRKNLYICNLYYKGFY
jgi:hypothetical protein